MCTVDFDWFVNLQQHKEYGKNINIYSMFIFSYYYWYKKGFVYGVFRKSIFFFKKWQGIKSSKKNFKRASETLKIYWLHPP